MTSLGTVPISKIMSLTRHGGFLWSNSQSLSDHCMHVSEGDDQLQAAQNLYGETCHSGIVC